MNTIYHDHEITNAVSHIFIRDGKPADRATLAAFLGCSQSKVSKALDRDPPMCDWVRGTRKSPWHGHSFLPSRELLRQIILKGRS